MKALSIKNPCAVLIARGIKDIENRTWRTNFRGRIYIHASLKPDSRIGNFSELLTDKQLGHLNDNKTIYLAGPAYCKRYNSMIVGEVDIIDCVKDHSSIWAEPGVWNWVLANPTWYPVPVMFKGSRSFWQPDEGALSIAINPPAREPITYKDLTDSANRAK